MRFHKNVPLEHREILTEQLKKYEKEMEMTSEERNEYSCAAEPPVQCSVSHLSRRSEPQ